MVPLPSYCSLQKLPLLHMVTGYHMVEKPVKTCYMTQGAQPSALGLPLGVGWGGRWKGGSQGGPMNLWLIHADVWQKQTQYCKLIIP